MAWNEPNNNDKKQDPRRDKQNNPPDLEELLRKLQQKLRALLNHKPKLAPKNTNSHFARGNTATKVSIAAIIVILIWAIAGLFVVGPGEQAVILRFGNYVKTVDAGLNWILPWIETKKVANVDKVITYSYTAKLLTQDENSVSVAVLIKYRIGNLPHYLFNAADPKECLHQAVASTLRQLVGSTSFVNLMTISHAVWQQQFTTLLKANLAHYDIGISIVSIEPQPAQVPQEVATAFEDVINAQADEKRFKEQAYAYEANIVPIAKGNAKRITEEAVAYSQQAVLHAKGEVAEFLELLPEYSKAPALMRERLYLETMQYVLTNSHKIIIDSNSTNVINLPLAQLLQPLPESKLLPSTNSAVVNAGTSDTVSEVTARGGSRANVERSTLRQQRGL